MEVIRLALSVRFNQVDIESARQSNAELAVVIDVLRAFTVAPWVHHQGASKLWLTNTLDEALQLKQRLGGAAIAMKDGDPAPGFGLTNSPDQISRLDLRGHQVVQRTTNGTVGVLAVSHVPMVMAASLVNVSATAQAIKALQPKTVDLVVTGEGGTADEDLAAAEAIEALVVGPVDMGPFVERVRRSAAAQRLQDKQAAGHSGVGAKDVPMSLEVDRFSWVMQARFCDLGTRLEFS